MIGEWFFSNWLIYYGIIDFLSVQFTMATSMLRIRVAIHGEPRLIGIVIWIFRLVVLDLI